MVDARTDRSLQAELEEAYALLDVIFARAPVGLALFDADLRYARVNDRMAAINGLAAAAHLGRTVREVLPNVAPDVEDDLRRVLRTGEPLIEVERSGETPARPGHQREWLSSYWPVSPRGGEITGIGAVVFEVTDRRKARRALRSQADRYEALLQALSEAGQGMVVVEEDGRCVYANAAFEQICGYTFPELTALDSLFELAVPGDRAEAARRAVLRIERGWVDTTYTLALRRRDGTVVELEVAGVPLESEIGRQLVVLVRDVTERRRIEAERERLLTRAALMAEASRDVRPVARRGTHARERRSSVRARSCGHLRARARRHAAQRPARRHGRPRARSRARAARAAAALPARGRPVASRARGDAHRPHAAWSSSCRRSASRRSPRTTASSSCCTRCASARR